MRPNIILALAVAAAAALFAACRPDSAQSSGDSSPQYSYGTKISFAENGEGAKYQVSGWSAAESEFTWTEGQTAVLAVRVPSSEQDLALRMRGRGFMNPPELPTQPIEVLVNDRKIADWEVGELTEHSAIVPQEMVKQGGLLTITFRIPKATSPKAAGAAEDPRVLGLCVHELELRKVG